MYLQSVCASAGWQRLWLGNGTALGSLDAAAEMRGLPQPVSCPGAQVAHSCSKSPLCSLVTIISYLLFVSIPTWLRGDQLASAKGHQPVSSAGSEG